MVNTKKQIAETAFQLFLTNGYKATTMSQLVTASGLSKGAFYHYFKSKEAIYQYVIELYFLSYFNSLDWENYIPYSLGEVEVKLNGFYKNFVMEIQKQTNKGMSRYFVVFFEAYDNLPEFKESIRRFYFRFKEVLQEKLIYERSLTLKEAEVVAVSMVAKYEGLFFWLALFPEKSLDEYLP